MNPFARKKWVNRQTAPIKDQVNELDQLQAKNANDIRDVDSRSQAGIKNALNTANTADQHAQDAANRANSAQTLASNASSRTDALGNTVGNLDQYQTVSATAVPFAAGRTTLGPTGKSDLDSLAATLGVRRDTSSRWRVIAAPACRPLKRWRTLSYATWLPSTKCRSTASIAPVLAATLPSLADDEKAIVNGVQVTLMHNSLATMGSSSASNGATPTSPTGSNSPQAVNQ